MSPSRYYPIVNFASFLPFPVVSLALILYNAHRMAPKKIIYIIPGFRQKPTSRAYKQIVKVLKSEGYLPIPIYIPWKKTTISEKTDYFLKQFRKRRAKSKSILGFSFGAIIGFLAATKVPVSALILCSLSPYFKEDIATSDLHSATLAKRLRAKRILMLYGKRESKPLVKRVTKTFRQIKSSHKYLIPIPATEHDIGNRRYLHTIHQAAKALH